MITVQKQDQLGGGRTHGAFARESLATTAFQKLLLVDKSRAHAKTRVFGRCSCCLSVRRDES
jgi:hypothetical protein